MSASHNPGGPKEDWGIKFNYSGGEPAPERITDAIFGFTQNISQLNFGDIPDTDLSQLGSHKYDDFEVSTFRASRALPALRRLSIQSHVYHTRLTPHHYSPRLLKPEYSVTCLSHKTHTTPLLTKVAQTRASCDQPVASCFPTLAEYSKVQASHLPRTV